MYYLRVILGLEGRPPRRPFSVGFDTRKERDRWRLKYDRLIERLNGEFDEKDMRELIPVYENIDPPQAPMVPQDWSPVKAIEVTREWCYNMVTLAAAR